MLCFLYLIFYHTFFFCFIPVIQQKDKWYATSSLGAGPLFEQSLISLRVKQWNEVDLNYFTEALLLCGLTVSALVDIEAYFRNSPHFSIGLILTDIIQMLGKFKWSVHNKTSTWNSC